MPTIGEHLYRTLARQSGRIFAQMFGPLGISLALLIILVVTVNPFIDQADTKLSAESDAVTLLANTFQPSTASEGVQLVQINVNWFVLARVHVEIIKADPNKITLAPGRNVQGYALVPDKDVTMAVKWDLLVAILSLIAVAFVGVRTLRSQIEPVTLSRPIEPATGPGSAETYLVSDVQRALERSEQLFTRSTLLLFAGVLTAFVGVVVFFLSLSEFATTSSNPFQPNPLLSPFTSGSSAAPAGAANLQTMPFGVSGLQVLQGFKSTAMLVFIESIAWFLLRQYRALIEDYKAFYRYYMRRSNYLITFKLTQSNEKLSSQFVDALLREDLSGRLKKGETTEVLEGQRVIDANFAETIVSKAADVARRATGHKE